MLFNLRFTAFCLVLLGASLSSAQSVRVRVNLRGDVIITGTSAPDNFKVLNTADGKVDLVGLADTTFEFNGTQSNRIALPGTSDNSSIRFNLGDGNDYIVVVADVKGVSGDLGRGEDFCWIDETTVELDVVIDCGVGAYADVVRLENSIARNVRINLGAGESSSNESINIIGCQIDGSLIVNQTAGDSHCDLFDVSVNGPTRVTLGAGLDEFTADANVTNVFDSLYVNLGAGVAFAEGQIAIVSESTVFGSVTLICNSHVNSSMQGGLEISYSSVFGNAKLNGGAGDDICQIYESRVTGNVAINTAAGDDYLDVGQDTVYGNITLIAGTGDDIVVADDVSNLDPISWSVNTGSGDDILLLGGHYDARTFSVVMGTGDDLVTNTFLEPNPVSFDTQIGIPRISGGGGSDTLAFSLSFDPGSGVVGFENFVF